MGTYVVCRRTIYSSSSCCREGGTVYDALLSATAAVKHQRMILPKRKKKKKKEEKSHWRKSRKYVGGNHFIEPRSPSTSVFKRTHCTHQHHRIGDINRRSYSLQQRRESGTPDMFAALKNLVTGATAAATVVSVDFLRRQFALTSSTLCIRPSMVVRPNPNLTHPAPLPFT